MKSTSVLKMGRKVLNRLFSMPAAGLYMVLFAVAIGAATFIENDFGTSAAQKLVYKAGWFELLLTLFAISLVVNIFRFRMVQQKKWALLAFHSAIIVILIGAGITRYFGYEGMMHIREESTSSSFLSSNAYLKFEAFNDGKTYTFEEPVLFATLGNNNFKGSYLIGGQELEVEVVDFTPNPEEVMIEDDNGLPVVKIVIGGANGREEYFVKKGDRVRIRGTLFNFRDEPDPTAFNIKYENRRLSFSSAERWTVMQMATQQRDTLFPGKYHPLTMRSLYSNGAQSFAMGDFNPQARVEIRSGSSKMASNSMAGLRIKVRSNGEEETVTVIGMPGMEGKPRVTDVGGMGLAVAYGSRRVELPFAIRLNDFIMEKYPGTNSASSYESKVTLVDPRTNLVKDTRIYMNNILNYGGYRFFQSSFDKDELGTYLSVNRDAPGTIVTYTGYALLTIGLLLTFFSKRSRFQQLRRNIKMLRKARQASVATVLAALFFAASPVAHGSAPPVDHLQIPAQAHAESFGELILQDYKGRFKPMNTHVSEILRKLSRKESLYGYSAEQVVLAMTAHPSEWYHVPMIKAPRHEDVRSIIGVESELLRYSDFFNQSGDYKLREHVRTAYNTPQEDRGKYEKEILKLDEKVNIAGMVFSGRFFKVFPVPGAPMATWQSPVETSQGHQRQAVDQENFPRRFYAAYVPTLQESMQTGDYELANRLIDELKEYQRKNGGEVLPSESKIKAELLLNKLNVFSRLGKVYGLLGLLFLALLFTSVFKPSLNLKWPGRIAIGLFGLAFLFHLAGLALRWYVSGRAPWSNGYESMIYIAFTTVLAGLLFSRKSLGGLAATNVLASTILMVAGLSFLDPEITPLVPVLKSYWLTIHVSLEAGSYGFLMLGALIGVINLIFMIFANAKNGKRVYRIVKELTAISEMTLIAGLVMISIGTYLGGVWANESWGRYWGWDAKETWALVTILVYAFILHMRFIPGFRGLYAFNLSTLFGWASVIMTYFGVNYYLSGLHSYAAGDPMPIPKPVFYTLVALAVISLLALWRYRAYMRGKKNA